jgi:hypothetical protein
MPDIRHSIRIAAPPHALRTLVADAHGLGQWWAEDVEQGPDGSVSLGFFNRATVYNLSLMENETHRVVWRCESGKEWQGTELVFSFRPEGSEAVLDFEHRNWRESTPYFTSCNTTWGGLMFRLKSAAEGRQAGPLFRKGSLDY